MEEKKEESELEEEVEDQETEEELEEISDEIMIEHDAGIPLQQINFASAPVLNQINGSQETPIRLEQTLAESPLEINSKSEEDFKYKFEGGQKDEPKYQSIEEEFREIQRTDIESLGREDASQQEVSFINEQKTKSQNIEKYVVAKPQDIESLGRTENPFEKKEVKYISK